MRPPNDGPDGVLQSVQVARGVAALLVVLFHLGGALAAPKYFSSPLLRHIFAAGGTAGVDFFFVLSGFIIPLVHWTDVNRPERFARYVTKRVIRIYPTYWLVLLTVCAIACLVPSVQSGAPSDPLSWLRTLALAPQDPALVGGTGAPVIIVAWSLQYEVIFYLLFGLLILNRALGIAAVGLGVAWIAVRYATGWPAALSYLQPLYFALFGARLIVALAVRAGSGRAYAAPALWAGSVAFVSLAALVGAQSAFPDLPLPLDEGVQTVGFGVSAALILFGMVTFERQGHGVTWPRGLLCLGDSSYVLYLVHFPIISVCCKIARGLGAVGWWGATLTAAATLTICIGVAIALHRYFERPLLDGGRNVLRGRAMAPATTDA